MKSLLHQQVIHVHLVHTEKTGSIIYGTDESELILQPHFYLFQNFKFLS